MQSAEAIETSRPRIGRPKTGKSSNPDFTAATIYIRKATQRAALGRILESGDGRDFSQLAEDLLATWIDQNPHEEFADAARAYCSSQEGARAGMRLVRLIGAFHSVLQGISEASGEPGDKEAVEGYLKILSAWSRKYLTDLQSDDASQLSTVRSNLQKAESPIEAMFMEGLISRGLWDFEAQYQIQKFRVDICFVAAKVVVEIDGHDFHSSKEARDSDTTRDRSLMAGGWRVIRFTGSQVHRNVDKCLDDLERILRL